MPKITFKIKLFFIKLYYFFVNPVKRFYYFIFRPKTRGVKCVIRNGNKILFVRLGYAHKGWTIPGGRVDRGESYEQAVIREVNEETGIMLGGVKLVGEYLSTAQYKVDTVQLFESTVGSLDFKIDNIEIVEARWCTIDDIPVPHGSRLEQQLLYLKYK